LKGRLPKGGRLDLVDLSPLDDHYDRDSRIKLERVRRHYPGIVQRYWIVGMQEWALITKQYRLLEPHWGEAALKAA